MVKFGREIWQRKDGKKRWEELYDSILLAMIDLAPFRRTEKNLPIMFARKGLCHLVGIVC